MNKLLINIFVYISISLLINCNQFVVAQTLHAVIFASTVDWRVKDGNTIIYDQLVEEMNRISEYTGMTLRLETCRDDNFNLQKAKTVINNISCGSNDCILVFFLGHGYRWDETSSIWPFLAFSNKTFIPDTEKNLVSWKEEEVFNILNRKGARFVGLFAEACNNSVGTESYTSNNNNNRTDNLSNILSVEKYKTLFLYCKGTILLSSSKANQVSYVNSVEGGLFMSRFLQTLHKHTASNNSGNPDWFTILHETKYQTINRAKSEDLVQVPQYEIKITYIQNNLQYEIADNLLLNGNNCTDYIIENYANMSNLVSDLQNGISMNEIKQDCYKLEEAGLLLLYDLKNKSYDNRKINNRLINFYNTKPQTEKIRNEINKLTRENN